MKTLSPLLLLVALTLAYTAGAQHDGHPGRGADLSENHTDHRADEHVAKGGESHALDPHAGHGDPAADPHADHTEHAADPALGHSADHSGSGAAMGHGDHNMVIDAVGMVMNHNPDRLPRDCSVLAGEVEIHVRAGREFATERPGLVYGYDTHEWQVPPCSKVNVTLENRDAVRHQWMVHGLPRYLYPQGMFTLEVNGSGSRRASFIVPSAAKTYLAHCDVPHHMEKGMKGQLVVGRGDGDLSSIPGVSGSLRSDRYASRWGAASYAIVALAAGLGLGASLGLLRR